MKIIEPSFEIKTPYGPLTPEVGVQMLQFIESMARISHMSALLQTEDTWKKFIESVVLTKCDWSITEHVNVTVIFRVDRGVTHELVRHRHFAFTQESTRFVRYGPRQGSAAIFADLEFIRPAEIPEVGVLNWHFKHAVANAESDYLSMLKEGARPQAARAVLPNSLAATIAVTGNLRAWRHLFLMRCSKETHPDFRRVIDPLLAEFKNNIPLLFDDIETGIRQADSQKKAR